MQLQCSSCSGSLGTSTAAVVRVRLLRPDHRVPRTCVDEVRRRCRRCGWVSIYQPVREPLALAAASAAY